MTMRKTSVAVAAAVLLAAGCAMKKPPHSEPYVIVMKTPKWRFADTGYVRTGDGVAELEAFEAGVRVLRLQAGDAVCVEGEGCLDRTAFNRRFLAAAYPPDTLYRLLRREPIFARRNLVRTPAGFTQHIVSDRYDIVYRVEGKRLYFKDRKNRILIKLKPIKEHDDV